MVQEDVGGERGVKVGPKVWNLGVCVCAAPKSLLDWMYTLGFGLAVIIDFE